jgi:hypothetical protein
VTVPGEDLDAGRPRVAIHRISQWESPSRGLVAEMMIIAGEAAGRLGEYEILGVVLFSKAQVSPLRRSGGTIPVHTSGRREGGHVLRAVCHACWARGMWDRNP